MKMTDLRQLYKNAGGGREDGDLNRVLRRKRFQESRHNFRSNRFGATRNLEECQNDSLQEEKSYDSENRENHRNDKDRDTLEKCYMQKVLELQKWREIKTRQKLASKKQTKPAFKAGVVHHRWFSPPSKTENKGVFEKPYKSTNTIVESQPLKKLSRVTEKRLQIKAVRNAETREKIRSKIKEKNKNKIVIDSKKENINSNNTTEPIQDKYNIQKLIIEEPNKAISNRINNIAEQNKFETLHLDVTEMTTIYTELPQRLTRSKSKDLPATQRLTLENIQNTSSKITNESFNNSSSTPTKNKKMLKLNCTAETSSNFIETTNQSLTSSPTISISTRKFLKHQSNEEIIPHTESLNQNSSKETLKCLVSNDREEKNIISETGHNLSLSVTLPKDTSLDKPPVFFSPYVVTTRGKNSARKEMIQRTRKSISEIPTKDTIMQTLNISIEEEERTAQYFKYILEKEIIRLNDCCEHWNIVKENNETPDDIRYLIQATVGQTQLLINKKFERFRGLVNDCEHGKGEMLVTCKDLQGFWDMMYMEIKNCDNRFDNLENLKSHNWVEEILDGDQKPKLKKPVVKKVTAKKKPLSSKPSSLRAHIMAARKKVKDKENGEDDSKANIEPLLITQKKEKIEKESIGTPTKKSIRVSTPRSTNKWKLPLKKMERSNSSRSTMSPLIAIKLSQMCKTPDVRLDNSISYINSDRTPAKSILKPHKDELAASITKSVNKVIFKEEPAQLQKFTECNDSINDDMKLVLEDTDEINEPVGRKLDFENISYNMSNEETITDTPMNVENISKSFSTMSVLKNNKSISLESEPYYKINDTVFDSKESIKKHTPRRSRSGKIESEVPSRVTRSMLKNFFKSNTPRTTIVFDTTYMNSSIGEPFNRSFGSTPRVKDRKKNRSISNNVMGATLDNSVGVMATPKSVKQSKVADTTNNDTEQTTPILRRKSRSTSEFDSTIINTENNFINKRRSKDTRRSNVKKD